MAFPISVFRAQVDALLAADSSSDLAQLARERQIKSAVERYSHDGAKSRGAQP